MQEALLAAATTWPDRRAAGQPARLAHPGGVPAHGRPVPPRRRPPPPRGRSPRRGRSRRPDAGSGPRRHADPHVHVLPPVAHAGVGDPADAAGGRRPHHPRDRRRVPRPRGDDGPADQPGQGQGQGVRRAVRAPARPSERAGAAAIGAARPLPPLQRGLRQQQRSRPGPQPTSPARPSAWPGASTAALPDDPEVAGLLALMLLTDARRPARTGADGELVPLAEQDRTPLGPGPHRRGRRR